MSDDYRSLYPTLMGPEWSKLDARLQRFHSGKSNRCASGVFQVRHGPGKLARFLAWFFRMPREGSDVQVRLIIRDGGVDAIEFSRIEIWERRFAGKKFTSFQSGDPKGRLVERVLGLELWLRLEVSGGALLYVPQGAAIALGPARLKLPRALSPTVSGKVAMAGDISARFEVSVRVTVPFAGCVLSYQGFIEPEVAAP